MIQRVGREIEGRRSKTSKGRGSQRVESGENTKQKKNKRSNKVFGTIKGVYSGIGHVEEERRLRKCKKSSKGIQRKIEYKSKTTRKVRLGRGKIV